MLSCECIPEHASWNEVFHYWGTKLSCLVNTELFGNICHTHARGDDNSHREEEFDENYYKVFDFNYRDGHYVTLLYQSCYLH